MLIVLNKMIIEVKIEILNSIENIIFFSDNFCELI